MSPGLARLPPGREDRRWASCLEELALRLACKARPSVCGSVVWAGLGQGSSTEWVGRSAVKTQWQPKSAVLQGR